MSDPEYMCCERKGGKQVHLLYWDEKPLIENLGSGTIDEIAVLIGNSDELQLYHNEIVGVNAFDWKAFPEALIVSEGKLRCGMIEDRLTDIEGLPDLNEERII